jgi:hypothetical protein
LRGTQGKEIKLMRFFFHKHKFEGEI